MMTLFELRKQLEMRHEEDIPRALVACRVFMAPQLYGKAERGSYIPNALETRELARFYGITLEEMIDVIEETVARKDAEADVYSPLYLCQRRHAKIVITKAQHN